MQRKEYVAIMALKIAKTKPIKPTVKICGNDMTTPTAISIKNSIICDGCF